MLPILIKQMQTLIRLIVSSTKGLDSLPNKTIVVSHQAFGYLCEAYGLTQMPIEGVEADAEPNAQE